MVRKKMFIVALTSVFLLGWSTVSNPTVANAAPMWGNPQQKASFQTGMDGQGLLNIWLQFRISNQQNYQQENCQYLVQQKGKQNNGLHLGQQKDKHNNGLHLGQQFTPENGQQSYFNIISQVADILDEDVQTIIGKLQAGSSLVEIAKSYGVSKASLLADLKDKIEDTIDNALATGTITKAQAEEMKSKLTEGLIQALESKFNNLNTYLSAPDNLDATSKSTTKISLEWDSVTDATSYYIYRATSNFGTYTKIDTVTSTSYTDDNLTDDTTYYYKVQAVNIWGSSVYSSAAKATTGDESDSDLDTPDGLTVMDKSSSEISLNWDSVDDARSYYVYRATSSDGTYTRIATVAESSYIDDGLEADKTYYYKVKAHNYTDTSGYSAIVNVTTD